MSEIFTQINLHENEAELLIVEEKAFRNATRNAFDALAYGNHSIKPYYKLCPIMQKPFLSLLRVQFFTLNE